MHVLLESKWTTTDFDEDIPLSFIHQFREEMVVDWVTERDTKAFTLFKIFMYNLIFVH